MAALRDRLRGELVASRKAQNKALTLVLGTVLSDIENLRAVMGHVVPQFTGRAEGSTINRIAREELSPSA